MRFDEKGNRVQEEFACSIDRSKIVDEKGKPTFSGPFVATYSLQSMGEFKWNEPTTFNHTAIYQGEMTFNRTRAAVELTQEEQFKQEDEDTGTMESIKNTLYLPFHMLQVAKDALYT